MVELRTVSPKLTGYLFCLVSFCIKMAFEFTPGQQFTPYLHHPSFLKDDDYFQHPSKKAAAVSCWLTRSQSC